MMKEEYIRKIDAHRIALHEGGDVCAQKILELKREPVILMTPEKELRVMRMIDELNYAAEVGCEYDLLERAEDLFRDIMQGGRR